MQEQRTIDGQLGIFHFFPVNADAAALDEFACFAFAGDDAGLCQEGDRVRVFVESGGAEIKAGDTFYGFQVFCAEGFSGRGLVGEDLFGVSQRFLVTFFPMYK